MIHVFESLKAKDLRGPFLALWSDEAFAEDVDQDLLGCIWVTTGQLESSDELLESVHLVVLDLVLNVFDRVMGRHHLLKGHRLLPFTSDLFNCDNWRLLATLLL